MTAAAAAETRTSHRATRVRVAPAPSPRSLSRQVRDTYVVCVWEVGFDSLKFGPVGGRCLISLLDLLEFLERYFLGVYLAEGMLHVGL